MRAVRDVQMHGCICPRPRWTGLTAVPEQPSSIAATPAQASSVHAWGIRSGSRGVGSSGVKKRSAQHFIDGAIGELVDAFVACVAGVAADPVPFESVFRRERVE